MCHILYTRVLKHILHVGARTCIIAHVHETCERERERVCVCVCVCVKLKFKFHSDAAIKIVYVINYSETMYNYACDCVSYIQYTSSLEC